MIRRCTTRDLAEMHEIINDAAQAYEGVIPDDRWHDPYMALEELEAEIRHGVEFWGLEVGISMLGVMGIQDKGSVTLIRHAYVRTARRREGIGTQLLQYLEGLTERPILIGTWSAATWAVDFYEGQGYVARSREETTRLLREYWSIPDRQIETSVVLAKRLSLAGR